MFQEVVTASDTENLKTDFEKGGNVLARRRLFNDNLLDVDFLKNFLFRLF